MRRRIRLFIVDMHPVRTERLSPALEQRNTCVLYALPSDHFLELLVESSVYPQAQCTRRRACSRYFKRLDTIVTEDCARGGGGKESRAASSSLVNATTTEQSKLLGHLYHRYLWWALLSIFDHRLLNLTQSHPDALWFVEILVDSGPQFLITNPPDLLWTFLNLLTELEVVVLPFAGFPCLYNSRICSG